MVSQEDKIRVEGDPRIQRGQAVVNGTKYGFLLSVPDDGSYKGTIILVHGFPDLSMGWRYQIPFLRSLGYRVVAPDTVGYGRSDAPRWCPENEQKYSYKQISADIKELARQLGSSQVILGGHDWGGMIVQRMALYEPEFVTHVFMVCTPYRPPQQQYIELADMAKHPVGKNFGYQQQFSSGEVEEKVKTPAQIRQVLNAMYGGWLKTDEGRGGAFAAQNGILFDRMARVNPTHMLSEKEMDYYVDEYSRNGIHAPLNYYRTRRVNWENELSIIGRTISVPVLFIGATRDPVLGPSTWGNMEKYLPKLTRRTVESGHWVLWDKPEEVNDILGKWIKGVVEGNGAML